MSIEQIPSGSTTMTRAEAVLLCRYTKACCPQQQIDQYTPDAWFDLLGDLRFNDCKNAITAVAKRQPFVSPSEIRDQVSLTRKERLALFQRQFTFEPPTEVTESDDPSAVDAAWYTWEMEWKRAVMDGDVTHVSQIAHARGMERNDAPPADVKALIDRIRANVVKPARKSAPEPLLGPDDLSREPAPTKEDA